MESDPTDPFCVVSVRRCSVLSVPSSDGATEPAHDRDPLHQYPAVSWCVDLDRRSDQSQPCRADAL